jgi:hypothetical protein
MSFFIENKLCAFYVLLKLLCILLLVFLRILQPDRRVALQRFPIFVTDMYVPVDQWQT